MTLWKYRRRERHDPAAGLGDLAAALQREDCPVCNRTAGADERWLDHFLYEGYLEPEGMRPVRRAGGFCAYHAGRSEALGQSATLALIYLALIEDCLPPLAGRAGYAGYKDPWRALPGSADPCEACAQAAEAERRECFFLALLIGARGPACYGAPAVVCMRHLAWLIAYLDDPAIGAILPVHAETAARLAAIPAKADAKPEAAADRAMRLILGPPMRPATPRPADAEGGGIPDPVGRMRRRLRHLPSCAICAEIADASSEWLSWLARAGGNGGEISDVLPLCRDHVWQAREAAGPALAPALAATVLREAEERLVYAARSVHADRSSALWSSALRRAFGASAAGAVRAALRRGRECPLCRRAREAGERALLLFAALLESADGRRAFESGYGLCLRHAAQAMAPPASPAIGEIVAATTRARLALLRWELQEQLRRGAWQARPERRGTESGAWLKAGARFAGTHERPPG